MIKKTLTVSVTSVVIMMLGSNLAQAKMNIGKTLAATAVATTATKAFHKEGEEYTELIQKFSDADLLALLKSEGYAGASIKREGALRVKIDGRPHLLFNSKRGDLQLYYGVTGVDVSYKNINQWNYSKKYSRAYLDKNMDPALESDLEAEGGLTRRQVLEFLDTFIFSVSSFRSFLLEHDKS
ncbi:MAG: hypothetical protein GQ531_06340 [Sulfurovum sp.]|nr:hypothetical protein [Sulfurovum sp.]